MYNNDSLLNTSNRKYYLRIRKLNDGTGDYITPVCFLY